MMGKAGLRKPGFDRKQSDDEDDDLYEGYNNGGAVDLATLGGKFGYDAMNSVAPMTAMRAPTASALGADARPMTSVRGVGYSSSTGGAGGAGNARAVFDPLQQGASKGPAPPLQKRSETSPEHMAREIEREINALLEASAALAINRDASGALEKAKEAARRERVLCKHREKHGLADQINYDLTYAVTFNFANQLANNQMFAEALNAYSVIVKNKQFGHAGRLRVNMGNIYYAQKKYPAAIKMYRMAMDQVGSISKEMRYKIMRNIANAFIRLGQFPDAIQSLESIMENCPDVRSGFNLIVCFYALGDTEKMKKAFLQYLSIPQFEENDEDDDEADSLARKQSASSNPSSRAGSAGGLGAGVGRTGSDGGAIPGDAGSSKDDELRLELSERQKEFIRLARIAAKLLAPVADTRDLAAGFDWVIEALKQPSSTASSSSSSSSSSASGSSSSALASNQTNLLGFQNSPRASSSSSSSQSKNSLIHVAMEMEIAKGIAYLKRQEFAKAIEVFKNFERKEQSLLDQAATNLSFLYFLEGDYKNAEKHAEFAVKADRYNAKALVNRANCFFIKGEFDAAKEVYLEAIGVEADCVEAIYNLGLVNKRLENFGDALQAFRKLHRIVPKSVNVIYHIANLFELMNEHGQAAEWFKILHGAVPTDARVLARLGNLYAEDDQTQAFHNFQDSYRYLPTNMEVITWLGVWYVKSELYEQAIQYFERAADIEPHEVKWQLMVASCFRRMGNYQQALDLYKEIHKKDQENIECLRYLCTLSKDLGDKGYEDYNKKLRKAERLLENAQQPSQFHRDDVPPQPHLQQHSSYDDHDDGSSSSNGGVGSLLQHASAPSFNNQFNGGTSLGGHSSQSNFVVNNNNISGGIAPRSYSRLQPRDEDVDLDDESVGDLLPL